jgi:hypothetical protein
VYDPGMSIIAHLFPGHIDQAMEAAARKTGVDIVLLPGDRGHSVQGAGVDGGDDLKKSKCIKMHQNGSRPTRFYL